MPKDKRTHAEMATQFVELVKQFESTDDFLIDNPGWQERLQEITAFLPDELMADLTNRLQIGASDQFANTEAFSRIYGLTKAETKLLTSLVAGLSVPDHAKKLGISVNTGRVHMQRILDKTAASGQLDLMKMLHKR